MANVEDLLQEIKNQFSHLTFEESIAFGELTIEVSQENLLEACQLLRDHPEFDFDCLMDVCGVDYLDYGISEWETDHATATGFERAVDRSGEKQVIQWDKPRFAVVYHLLSTEHNHRLRLRVFVEENSLLVE